MTKKCDDPLCYNYDRDNSIFCDKCLEAVIEGMDWDDLYDMYVEGMLNLERAITDAEALGVLTKDNRVAIIECGRNWFEIINKIMLKKSSAGI